MFIKLAIAAILMISAIVFWNWRNFSIEQSNIKHELEIQASCLEDQAEDAALRHEYENAIDIFEELIDKYPETRSAIIAKKRIAELKWLNSQQSNPT
ncbi:hypothetical protein ACFL54_07360, partial [Planctomycetota bacterium]